MRSKPYGDPSMGLRWPRAECYDAQGPPWLYPQKVQSRAMTLLGERPTGQKRTQRAASLILGQPPRLLALPHLMNKLRLPTTPQAQQQQFFVRQKMEEGSSHGSIRSS